MHELKPVLDGLSLLTAGATLIGWIANVLPPLAALVSILWMGFQWYHSMPMREWRTRRRDEL